MSHAISEKASRFTESVIREMTRLVAIHGGINLAQGFPDFAAPDEVKEAAVSAIRADVNQYAITWGAKSFRDAITAKFTHLYGMAYDPETEVTVTCGATEGMIASLLALVNPGDEVVVFEPFYENYGPDAILSGAIPRFVPLHPPDWTLDREELAAAFGEKTRAIVVNTPNNPTGKVFTKEELGWIAELCEKHGAIAVTDEIYEHIVYDDAVHVSLATLPGMRDRTVTVNALSKTYSVTGWRVGYVLATAPLTSAIRKVHDFLTVGAPAPLQEAGAVALQLPAHYYVKLAAEYKERRDYLLGVLQEVGFDVRPPRGAYYIMADFRNLSSLDDATFGRELVRTIGVASVPGSSFYEKPEDGRTILRFGFPKRMVTLQAAAERLRKLKS